MKRRELGQGEGLGTEALSAAAALLGHHVK
jgi:hypothetical protein